MIPGGLRDAVVDLALGGTCAGCGRPGRLLCGDCRRGLPRGAAPARPTPAPAGLPPTWAATTYEATVRTMVLGHKERRQLALAAPLGGLLAAACRAALAAPGGDRPPTGPVLLVPVPSRPGSDRSRGHAPTAALVRRAARAQRAAGYDARPAPRLRSSAAVADQAGLGAAARAANLSGTQWCSTAELRRVAARTPRARVLVCDDVLTTGATLAEATRALRAVGVPVEAGAVVAATVLRHRAGSGPPGRGHLPG